MKRRHSMLKVQRLNFRYCNALASLKDQQRLDMDIEIYYQCLL